jgi:hypothetical protein
MGVGDMAFWLDLSLTRNKKLPLARTYMPIGLMRAILECGSHRLPKKYRNRQEGRPAWIGRYSGSEWRRVEHFLFVFCDGFLLRRRDAPYLYPNDKPMEIYREMFQFWPVDDLQFPFLQKALVSEYGFEIPLDDFEWQTLGDLYDRVRNAP